MLRLSWLMIGILGLATPMACKKKASPAPADSLDSGLQGKPDKISEEPTGLPGYPLQCRWVQGPASDTLEASLNCFLGDDRGSPAQLSEKLNWTASVSENSSVVQEIRADQSVALTVKSTSRDVLTLAIQNMQLKATYKSQEKVATGRDVLKAEPKTLRLASSCKDLFTLLFVDDLASFSFFEMTRFTGCEQLATTLQNAVVPNGASRQLPDRHKTVQASCKDGLFTLSIIQPTFQGGGDLGPIDPEACEDLRGLVNNQGL
ncbi:MAG: hypothetical protein M3Q07_18515 [Pseudobdellovibrionaceae bacterium]|nr:hypothetical protein [Pseudobdellovibrionaceae bacterium]